MGPATCAAATAAGALVAAVAPGAQAPLLFAGCVVGLAARGARSSRPLKRLLAWLLPLGIPLMLMHGLLNPEFPVSARVGGLLPVRGAGLAFALEVTADLCVILAVSGAWSEVGRDHLLRWLASRGLPPAVLFAFGQAVAVADLARRRIDAVYLAQQARGIPAGPGPLARLRALPSMVLPVVTTLVVEGERRAEALAARGLALDHLAERSTPILAPGEAPTTVCLTVLAVALCLLGLMEGRG